MAKSGGSRAHFPSERQEAPEDKPRDAESALFVLK